jgi:hypothetical protein
VPRARDPPSATALMPSMVASRAATGSHISFTHERSFSESRTIAL